MASKITGKIVDAAVYEFGRKGFCSTTTKEISIRANVTEGSIFRLFPSKRHLVLASIERVVAAIKRGKTLNRVERRILTYAILEFLEPLKALLRKHRAPLKAACIELPGVLALAAMLGWLICI